MNKESTRLIFEKSVEGRTAYSLPDCDVPLLPIGDLIPDAFLREEQPALPELSELEVLRHFVGLSHKNHGILNGFYPLGSCTMKYNPAVHEDIAKFSGFSHTHPHTDPAFTQGNCHLMYDLQHMLAEITGMDAFSLQPAAGAHGELAGLFMIKAYHEKNGEPHRTKILIPDTAHGTNPASVSMAGLEAVEIQSDQNGNVDLSSLQAHIDENLAGLMLTNPSTLGLFETNVEQIAEMIHAAGGLLYYDGANLNAIIGVTRPGDMGFDVCHLNLHKTFATPHGGGGPGAGPVGVTKRLAAFLPCPVVEKEGDFYTLRSDLPDSVGMMRSFYGNFGVLVKAYAYIVSMGAAGLRAAAENAVLNANYLMAGLKEYLQIPYPRTCMHEFVASGAALKEKGCSTLDVAKRLLDFSVHPPTVYFPLIVKEAMMFEPTETESKQTLDDFIRLMRQILQEDPTILQAAPHHQPVGRLDDTKAARKPVLIWRNEHGL